MNILTDRECMDCNKNELYGKLKILETAEKILGTDLIAVSQTLKIIKEKGIDTNLFRTFTDYFDYLDFCASDEMFRKYYGVYTEEEFNLVRRGLK